VKMSVAPKLLNTGGAQEEVFGIGIAGAERAVAPTARVVAAAEIGELVPLGRRDEHVAGVRVGEGGPDARDRLLLILELLDWRLTGDAVPDIYEPAQRPLG